MSKTVLPATGAVDFSGPRHGREAGLGKYLMVIVLTSGVLALAGCSCDKSKTAVIHAYPDPIAVNEGDPVVLEAHASPYDSSGDWKYQWQQIIGGTDNDNLVVSNLPAARGSQLVVEGAEFRDANLYRCMIYRDDQWPETNYTTPFSLQVSGGGKEKPHATAIVTTVSGSFKPGTAGGQGCGSPYTNALVFLNPTNGDWWPVPGGGGTVTVKDESTVNYVYTPVELDIVDPKFHSVICPCPKVTNGGSYQFMVNAKGYMFCLHFTGKLPPSGQQFLFAVTWPL